MVNPFYKNLRLRTFAAVMLLNFFVILLISIFFQQRSLSFFEREFAATLYEQAKGSGQRVDNGWQSIYQATVHASFDARLQAMMQEDEIAHSREIAERLRAYKKENPLIDRISLYDPSTHLLIRSDEYQAVQQLDDRGEPGPRASRSSLGGRRFWPEICSGLLQRRSAFTIRPCGHRMARSWLG